MPTLIIVFRLAPYMFFFLWGTAFYGAWVLTITANIPFTKSQLKTHWNWQAVTWQHCRPLLARFVVASLLLYAFMQVYDPARLFGLIERSPAMWAVVMGAYPILSALPQEFIFCSFFFARYITLFRTSRALVIASACVFGYAHVLFINPIAPVLSIIAGYFFASTYMQHRSLALVTLEHALYGNMLFTLGLGWYFYHGSVG
jgi:hypothetical protein